MPEFIFKKVESIFKTRVSSFKNRFYQKQKTVVLYSSASYDEFYSDNDEVKKLKESNKKLMLETLMNGVMPEEKKKGKLHQVFRSSFDTKVCWLQHSLLSTTNYRRKSVFDKY